MTSLSQQLKRLTVPQTTNLAELKKSPSILFDQREATTKDRKSIYDLGCEGLSELIALNHVFTQFEETLFEHTSLNIERSMEDSTFNKVLDKNIKKFFNHLSPYFMLRSSHLCLEWLIRRFQVHEYNVNDFVALILPYHETNIFVRCVQILRLNDESHPWYWLKPLQKPGVPLPKSAIFNRAASQPSFLQFVCKSVIDATKELGSRAPTLQCLINFYCSVVIGGFENCQQIKEWHVTTILPSITSGMKSDCIDFISASFMILTQLVNKTQLNVKLLNVLVSHIWKVDCKTLQSSSVLLLNWIAKTQADVLTQFQENGFVEFIEKPWLNNIISQLSRDGISMIYLTISMIGTAFHILQNDMANAEVCRRYIESLLFEVHFPSHSARMVIKCVLERLSLKEQKPLKDGDIIDLESDTEMPSQENVMNWFIKIIQILERQYPSEMDVVIKEAMAGGTKETSKNGIKIALAYRYKFLKNDTSSLFEKLYHVNPKIRAISIREIINQINKHDNDLQHLSMLKEVLADRINDDNEKVVGEILKLSTSLCIEMIGIKSFVDNIIKILDKASINPHRWSYLQPAAITHLTSAVVVRDYDSNIILLAVSRYLIPITNDNENAKYVNIILQSPLAKKKSFFQTLVKKYKDTKIDLNEFKNDFLDILSMSDDAPNAEDLVESIKKNGEEIFKTSIQMSHFLIMVAVCFKSKNDIEKAINIYDFTMNQCSHFRITVSNSDKKKSNNVPLVLFIDFIKSMVLGTHFESLQDWKTSSKSLKLFVSIFNLLTLKAFSSKLDTIEKQEWTKSLRDILNLLFPTIKEKLNFLSQFLIHENLSGAENYAEVRIRGVRLLEIILRGGKVESSDIDLRFILRIIVALSSPLPTIRECALDILRAVKGFKEDLSTLIGKIIERSEEIQFDAEQIPLILFTILGIKRNTSNVELVANILNIISDPAESIYFKSKIVEILKHIKSASIVNSMIPAALLALENTQTVGNIQILDEATANIFKSVITRFDENCIKEVISLNENAWQLIKRSFELSKVFLNFDGKLTPVPCITLQILDEATYNQLPNVYKIKLLKLIIETVALSDNDALFLDVNKAIKKCSLDCKNILPVLQSMTTNVNEDAKLQKKKRSVARVSTDDNSLLNSIQWKEGIVLLEILENKKKLQNTQVLIPVLFDTLKRCLDMENQSPAEYTKQLILSALLQCCQKSKAENLLCEISESTFRIDLIVQCIRVTQNPQTHYNALLFLSHCAVLFPQQVLHNLVDIFTFMGSSIARQDDAFSFQIISNIVESIIPILVEDNNSMVAVCNKRVVPVLKIFSDILLDVPEHRRTPLYTKLLSTLGAENYFWLFLCVVFESQVISEEKAKLNDSNKQSTAAEEKIPKRVEIVLNLLNEFSTSVSIQTCTSLLAYVKRLPMNKEEENDRRVTHSNLQDSQDNNLFDVNARSAKQLRHYKYLILQFVSTFTSSVNFLTAISALNEEQNILNKPLYQKFIIKTLSYIPDVTSAIEKSTDPTQLKFWKVIQHHCYDALDNVISLLSPDIFLVAVHGLMQHKLMTIRKKVIELLISKLQKQIDYFENCSDENVLSLLNSLCELVGTITIKDHKKTRSATITTSNANENTFVQQVGLIAIKLLSRQFALKYKEQFKNIVEHLTNVTKKRSLLPKVVLATVILTLVEVMSNLKVHAIAHLPKFMPHLIEALNDQSIILQKQSPDSVCLALLTGIQKLFESMPLFLGPYIVGMVSALSKMWSHMKHRRAEHEQKIIVNMNKLEAVWKKIATEVPARVLIPNCESAYYELMNDGNVSGVSFLMQLFFECLSNASDSDLSAVQVELTNFFLKCLEFRSEIGSSKSSSTSIDDICSTEMEIIKAFVAWILKLSESSFRPVYKKIYDWGFEKDGPKERVLTYFILNRCISNSLKSLFVLFSSNFIQNAAELLTTCNTFKNTVLFFENSDELNVELLKNILYTLNNIFVYDSKDVANHHRFNILMQPIVDQLENKLILENEELQGILLSCIAQLAVAVSSDVLWKQLHYQILLKTRANVPEVRIISFNCCVELARKLGDDFTTLLPETVPFIAELFEDENALVVKNSRRAVQELEGILGESLQKYL